MKLITADIRKKLLANGAAADAAIQLDGNTPDAVPVLKLFVPWGAATWLITEMHPGDPDIMFGLCDLGHGCPELGSVSLTEIESIRGPAGLTIERDMYFTGKAPISVYADAARAAGHIVEVS